MLLAWLPLLALLVVYDYLRGAVSVAPARAHVDPQIAVDRWLAGGDVPTRLAAARTSGAPAIRTGTTTASGWST